MPDRQDPIVQSGASCGRTEPSLARRFPGERALRRLLAAIAGVALVLYFGVAATVLVLRYAVLPHLDTLRPRIEHILSDKLHATVRIGNLSAHWSGLQPSLDIRQLTIRDQAGNPALSVPRATATVSWRSLPHWQPLLSSLVIERPDVLATRDAQGNVTIAGIALNFKVAGKNTFATWLLTQRAVVLRQATLHWRDAERRDGGVAPELTLTGIQFAALNTGHRHRIGLQAQPDGKLLRGPLDLRADFTHGLLTAAGVPGNWTGQAYAAPGALDLPTLARYVKLPIAASSGQVDGHVWVKFAHGRIGAAQGDLSGAQLLLHLDPALPALDVPSVSLNWEATHTGRDYALNVADLRMELGAQPPLSDGTPVDRLLQIGRFSGHLRQASHNRGQIIGFAGDTVDIGLLAEFARTLPLPRETLNNLALFKPRGILRNYAVRVERAPPRTPAGNAPLRHYHLQADFEGVSLAAQKPAPGLTARGHPHVGLPGFENLSGRIDADEKQGALTLASQHAAVTILGLFDEPRLAFDHIAGHASWKVSRGQAHPAIQLDLPELTLSNADAQAHVRATYHNPGQGRGSLDLLASFDRLAAARIARYLPTSINAHLRGYLGHAIQSGVSRNATIQVRGDLAQFPYERNPNAGVFHIVAPFTAGRFDPSAFPPRRMANGALQNWPALEDIDGTFELQQNVLRFDIDRARYRGVALSNISGRIAELSNRASNLVISGQAHGPLNDMLHYLNASPVATLAQHASARLSGTGDAGLALHLEVPRHPKPHMGVSGTLSLADNTLTFGPLPPLTQLQGKIDFTEHSLVLDGLAAQFLGGKVAGSGGLKPDGSVDLDVSGQLSADAMRGHYQDEPASRLMRQFSGSAPYSLSVHAAAHQRPSIVATSDLRGLGIDLPAPLGKVAGAPMPFKLTLDPGALGSAIGLDQEKTPADDGALPATEKLSLQLGPLAAAYVRRGGAHPAVLRGAIGFERPVELPAQGVTANLQLPHLDIDAWRAALRKLGANPSHRAEAAAGQDPSGTGADPGISAYLPDRLQARVGSLTLLDRQWRDVTLDASHQNGTWQAQLASDQAQGHISWSPRDTHGPAALQARLTKLAVPAPIGPKSRDAEVLSQALDDHARDFPSIDVIVDTLSVRGHDLGRLEMAAHNTHDNGVPVWQLDKLDVSNPAATLSATGNWRTAVKLGARATADDPRRTALRFKFDIADAGALLARMGQPLTLRAGSGTLTGNIGWRGSPSNIDDATLRGKLSLDLKHGQILQVKPGIGRLLGVLSLQSLARFLTLDFNGVVGKGLPFDSVTGTGTIRDGIASTDDFRIVSGAANIVMKGSADIAKEQQNLLVTVMPKINAGSAALAAAVVNPLLGLGGFVAQMVLSESLSKSFARNYAVTGSWEHPQIQRVGADRGNMVPPVMISPVKPASPS